MISDKEIKNKIKAFWDKQAQDYKEQGQATSPDIINRELEIDNVTRYIKDNTKVIDIGCGNGYSTIKFVKKKNIEIVGIDSSTEMIEQAKLALSKTENDFKERITFQTGDVLEINDQEKFDIVVTCRCLINLINFDEQKRALQNIHKLLRKDGLYIMSENTLDGLNKINSMRAIVGLNEIPMRWHNQYFDEKLLFGFLEQYFEILEINNFASLYYIASRVFNAKLTPSGKEPNYLAEINKIAAQLPSVGDYGPTKIFVLKKIKK